MAKETTEKKLYNLLVTRDYDNFQALDSRTGKVPTNPENGAQDVSLADMFAFDWSSSRGKNYGTAVILLTPEHELELYFGDNLGKTMEDPEDKNEWFAFMEQLRHFATRTNFNGFRPLNINQLRHSLQGQAAIKEGLFESWQGRKNMSWSAGPTEARLMIKHKRNLDETDARHLYIENLFIETAEGERYKLPFTKLVGGRAMLEHVRQGGRPYDIRGQHIVDIVEELNVLGRFERSVARETVLEGDTAQLVSEAAEYRKSLKENLKRLGTGRGYATYFEGWNPVELTEQDVVIESLKHMFVKQTLDARIEQALPVLARIQQQGNAMKEANIFEAWAERLVEGTWSTPDTPESQQKLLELMSAELPVGADATNATEQLYDLLGDDKLFDLLESLAQRDPNADCRQIILDRMQELSDLPDVRAVLEQLNIDADATMNPPESMPADLSEGAMKDMLWKMCERMDRQEFIDYCVGEWGWDPAEMGEFWDGINGDQLDEIAVDMPPQQMMDPPAIVRPAVGQAVKPTAPVAAMPQLVKDGNGYKMMVGKSRVQVQVGKNVLATKPIKATLDGKPVTVMVNPEIRGVPGSQFYVGVMATPVQEQSVAEDDVDDFLNAGGKITQVKSQRGPRRPGLGLASKHIGGGGDRMKPSRTGRGANTQGKPVVAAEGSDHSLKKVFDRYARHLPASRGDTSDVDQMIRSSKILKDITKYVRDNYGKDAVDNMERYANRQPGVTEDAVRSLRRAAGLTEGRMLDEDNSKLDHILDRFKYEVRSFEQGGDLDKDLYEALFDYYYDIGEMPYGTAKARDGDPYEWVAQNLESHLRGGGTIGGVPDEDYGLERESVGDYAPEEMRAPHSVDGGMDNAILYDDSTCNMSEAGENCPIHGLDECWGAMANEGELGTAVGAGIGGAVGGLGGAAVGGLAGHYLTKDETDEDKDSDNIKNSAVGGLAWGAGATAAQAALGALEEKSPLAGIYGHSGKMKEVGKDTSFLDRLKTLSGMAKS